MTKKTGVRTKGRYQQKREAGLVPHHYDRDSRSFSEGAWKHWPHTRDSNRNIISTMDFEARNDSIDRKFLEQAREAR